MKGFLRAMALVVVAVVAMVGLRLMRAESVRTPVPTQRDLHASYGVPVETAEVVAAPVRRRVRVFGTARGSHQAEVVVPSPNVLEQLHVRVGQEVRRGQTLATMRAVSMSPLGYPYAPLQAKNEAAQADLGRYEALAAQEAITGQQLEHARAQARAAEADWQAARAAVHVSAPIAGVVTRIDFRVGDVVPNDRPLAQVARIDTLVVDFMVEPVDIGLVTEGMPVEITSSARPGDLLTGEVVERALAAHPMLNQFKVVVEVANPGRSLLPGFPLEGALLLGSDEPVLAVPEASLAHRQGSTGVWVAAEGVARWVPVEVGLSDRTLSAVTGELQPGWRVVTLGSGDLHEDGTAVLVVD